MRCETKRPAGADGEYVHLWVQWFTLSLCECNFVTSCATAKSSTRSVLLGIIYGQWRRLWKRVKEVCGRFLFCVFFLGDGGLIMVVWKNYSVKFLYANREANNNNNSNNNNNNNNNNNPAASTISPQVTCIVNPTCFLTSREVAIGFLAKSYLLYFVSLRPFLYRFEHFIRLWETVLTYAKFRFLTAVLLNFHLAVSFRH